MMMMVMMMMMMMMMMVMVMMMMMMVVREAELGLEAAIGPVEESFSLLNKHQLLFGGGAAERVDGLTYAWTGLRALGVAPAEASERLQSFQAEFDQLWRKYTTCSGGEQLFGLAVHEYPELQRIRRELSLMEKLYALYNAVIERVSGYDDVLWADLDLERINGELQDFQSRSRSARRPPAPTGAPRWTPVVHRRLLSFRIRKLPKALKEWQAFRDLKKTIDDFTETCPLLGLMADKVMLPRHWSRLSQLTAHRFPVEEEGFSLRSVLEAPLLRHKEDIEVLASFPLSIYRDTYDIYI
ncbi:Dynein heavy chain 5, axonemal [Liparis tanakae]|uniref:Dynein heavy chain 5, axonemal n=1 Tax=Liparis tanakae TaxID=230148 RepID=A0A4Z2E5I0_9TELE|nr:Dynein heavy chain 5, axonemal [Liparis tanakae]